MANRTDAPAKSKLRIVIRFLQAEGCNSAVPTQQLLEQFKWKVSDHPAYSPDLATSDFHPLPELKNWVRGQRFLKNEKIQSKVKALLTPLAAMFFEEGIGNLVYRYNKCLNLHGDYVER
ncbi:hypothetical protein AVEN_29416-1 [Araneus ventricosus]|uniref:Histone-lysine N-methyltransferase SETMAR n=1 Tax=Araneus ventricosus TaxID=182803 RepID=A0A4Y2CYL2_ARAVE|nr:hypothetical protein AVEN_29416-1 [Araneus ventricosus]